ELGNRMALMRCSAPEGGVRSQSECGFRLDLIYRPPRCGSGSGGRTPAGGGSRPQRCLDVELFEDTSKTLAIPDLSALAPKRLLRPPRQGSTLRLLQWESLLAHHPDIDPADQITIGLWSMTMV